MLPILVSLGPVKIYSYGVCMALGLFLSLYWWWKMGRDEHFDEIALFDGFFLMLITFLLAGRGGYVISHSGEVGTIYRALAFLAYPGINVAWGMVGATIGLWAFARSHDWQIWKVLDAYVVALSLVLIFGGLAGFLNGSNPGIEARWGVLYPGETARRIPVDVWIWFWAVITFAVVSRVRKNFRFYSWYKGESSMAQEGLATLIFVMLVGVYFVVAWMLGMGSWLVGVVMIVGSALLIYNRVGRRETRLWSKLSNIIRRS